MASSPQLPNAASEETPKKDDVQHGSGSTCSAGSEARNDLFPKTREQRKKETIRSLRNAFLDVGQDKVDPKWDPILNELTSLVASCSFNEEELKWKPLPPIDSNLSIEVTRVELEQRRRYSPELSSYLLNRIDVQPIDELRKYFMDKSKSKCLYYTYVLVDPRSHDDGIELDFEAFIRGVFYIGKGYEGRCADHFFTEGVKGKCRRCSETCVLEDMMMPMHNNCSSPEVPAQIQCADCLNFIKVREGKFIAHPCSSLEPCDAGLRDYAKLCHSCLQAVDVLERENEDSPFKLKPHERPCAGAGQSLSTRRKCPDCREEVAVYKEQDEHPEGTIKPHGRLCTASKQKLRMGVCLKCKQSNMMIYQKKTLPCVAGDMKPHPQACSKSGKLPPKIVLDIKHRKVSSIWKAGRMPTAVVCSQGETNTHGLQKEAMMMMAYGEDNRCSQIKGGYLQGKLVNKNMWSKLVDCLVTSAGASECRKYGVELFIKAWKTYRNTDKPGYASRIMWPRNPNEVQPSDDDDDDCDDDAEVEEQEEQEEEEEKDIEVDNLPSTQYY